MDVTFDEVLVMSDRVKEDGLAIVDPTKLSISELAFPRWVRKQVLPAFSAALPSFKVKIEGKPKAGYVNEARRGTRLQPYQCEWREVSLFEKESLEALVRYFGVTDKHRFVYSPLWYVIPYPETETDKPSVPGNVLRVSQGKPGEPDRSIEISSDGSRMYPYFNKYTNQKIQVMAFQERVFLEMGGTIVEENFNRNSQNQFINIHGEPL